MKSSLRRSRGLVRHRNNDMKLLLLRIFRFQCNFLIYNVTAIVENTQSDRNGYQVCVNFITNFKFPSYFFDVRTIN